MDHHEVPERKYKSGRLANSNISRTKGSDMFKPESTGVGNIMPASHNKEMEVKGPMVDYKGKSKIVNSSGPVATQDGNIEDMLREHERNVQEAVRKARCIKS